MSERDLIASYVNLIYKVAAQTVPDCEIERDPLHRRYSVNYGVQITVTTLEKLDQLSTAMQEALKSRNIGGTLTGFLTPHGEWRLDVWPCTDPKYFEVRIDRSRDRW